MFDRRRFTILLGAAGILGGVLYAELIGCETGCTIKSSPFMMGVYGVVIGGLLGSWIDDYRNRNKKVDNHSQRE